MTEKFSADREAVTKAIYSDPKDKSKDALREAARDAVEVERAKQERKRRK